ncbi:hypothetical protein OEA41_007468 [Lepraria neglecta]|uniref:Uncharacterized protein n=1 Tax=Lepraria neglecta TaxID=209136 RepID=A0AAD9ZCR9_9LECA|nr:hypothetical protein OEA41_007468 [Lepraria neglecta]
MDRTPIRIRGKKKVPARTTGARQSTKSMLSSDPKAKRPWSDTSGSSTPAAKLPCQAAPKLQRTKCSSRLELLPTELLETIFFYCVNISLPQASPAIGHKLASTLVKSRLVLGTLSGLDSIDYSIIPWSITSRELGDAQSAILRQKWMTLPFLKRLIPDFIVKTIVQEFGLRKLQWMGEGPVVSQESEPIIRKYLEDNALRFDHTSRTGLPAFWEVSWTVEGYPDGMLMGIGLRDGLVTFSSFGDHREDSETYWDFIETRRILSNPLSRGCQIPEKLLHGPWTDEKCEFLEIAIRGNAQVDWVASTSGEVAEKGLMQAIEEHNARATRALLARIGSGPQPCDSTITLFPREPTPNADGQWVSEPHSIYREDPIRRGVGIIPQQKHLRKAVLEEGCPRDVVEALLEAAETNFDFDDGDILQWITGEMGQGNKDAEWLREYVSPD